MSVREEGKYLVLHDVNAAAEFQNCIDHRGGFADNAGIITRLLASKRRA
jgi:hypothetical protein